MTAFILGQGMSDISVGGNISAGGDVVLGDNNKNGSKLWVDSSSDELREDFYYRKKLLSSERVSKWKRIAIAGLVVGAIAAVAAVYFYLVGQANLSSLIMGGAGIFMAFATMKVTETPTDFEQRQMASLNEIRTLLRERGERV